MRACASSVVRTFATASFQRVRIGRGKPFGPHMPYQWLASYPGTVSLTAGTSGRYVERFAVVTASARTLPDFTCGMLGTMLIAVTGTSPPTSAVIAGPPPL